MNDIIGSKAKKEYMPVKTIVHVGGTAYSGSTLLDLMLSNAENAFSCGEVNALFRPYRMHHFHPKCSCGSKGCNVWQEILANGEQRLWKFLSIKYPEVDFFIDSSKDLVWLRDKNERDIEEGFKRVNLIIWKTPAEYAYSRMKRGKLRGWKRTYINYHERYFNFVNEWFSVRYSDLANNPKEKLKTICDRIGMLFFLGKEEYWHKVHHSLFGSYSAKLHLYKRDSGIYKEIADNRDSFKPQMPEGGDLEMTSHKTIYYDQDILIKLPLPVRKEIESDKNIDKITHYLEAKEVGSENALTDESSFRFDHKTVEGWYKYQIARRCVKYVACKALIALRAIRGK